MKLFFLLATLFIAASAFAQRDTIVIRKNKFITIRSIEKTEYNPKDTLLKLYRISNGKREYLLTHYTFRYGADCNNIFKDYGSLKVSGDSIILYTRCTQKGFDPIPQATKQIYKVSDAGKLSLIYDKQKINGKWINPSIQ
jgi:hypothetical protein